MWVTLAFGSALLLGLYDIFKKTALSGNAVIPVLFLNTALSLSIYIPFIVLSSRGIIGDDSIFHIPAGGWSDHRFVVLKSFIVLSAWMSGYFGIKHLPLTIVGPINATRPVMVLVGAMLIFGERLNLWQWCGVVLAFGSIVLLSRTGKKEGIDFRRNKWIFFVALSAVLSAVSGLYDKFLMGRFAPMFVQSWFNLYQFLIMAVVLAAVYKTNRCKGSAFTWRWAILLIPLTLAVADFLYFYALSQPGSMVSVVSMIRRSSVIVSFGFGALLLHEKNVGSKSLDLAFILVGMVFIYIGSH